MCLPRQRATSQLPAYLLQPAHVYMATASILSPTAQTNMAARRAPLASVPNAINSPFRSTQPTNAKRTRAQAGENTHGQPPAKKQIIEIKSGDEENVEPRRRSAVSVISNEKEEPFGKRTSNHQPTAFEKKLLVAKARERKPVSQSQQHAEKPQKDNLESVRQWQRHYKRQFPGFVFYFDNVPDDVRLRATRQIQSLGAVRVPLPSCNMLSLTILHSVKKSSSPRA